MRLFHITLAILCSTCLVACGAGLEFAPIQCPPNGKPRVRREWRTLTPAARDRVARAVWTMRNHTGEEGRSRFGPDFVSYEELILLHTCSFADPRCDQGHFSPAFITFHRAMLLKFENSLLAIDPRIEALPYWNLAFDSENGKYRNDPEKYIFTDKFFGSFRGDPKENFAVVDGLFARFPIVKYNPTRHSAQSGSNLQCLQEGRVQYTRASTCRRCCGKPQCKCDRPGDVFDTFIRGFDDCSPYTVRNYEEFAPFDGTREILYSESDFDQCTNTTVIRSMADWQRCIDMAGVGCLLLNNPDVSEIAGDDTIKLKTLAYLAKEPTQCSLKGVYTDRDGSQKRVNAHHSQIHFRLAGDMKDVATSPNDPIFFSYHADADRNSMTWMAKTQYLEREHWNFPKDQVVSPNAKAELSGPYNVYHLLRCELLRKGLHPDYYPFSTPWIPGTLLNDIISSGFPLSNLFGGDCQSSPHTHREVIEMSSPSQTIYTYDTLEHLYDNCEISDRPKCETEKRSISSKQRTKQ